MILGAIGPDLQGQIQLEIQIYPILSLLPP